MVILILHDIESKAGAHWMGWLSNKCEKLGHRVIMPDLPSPNHPKRGEWLKKIFWETEDVDLANLVVVGHSLGVTSALDFIEALKVPVKALISVSGFYRDYGVELNSYFLKDRYIDLNLNKVEKNVKSVFVLYGDNDPYVPQKELKALADGLKIKPEVIKNGGHLNSDAGYAKFPRLLEIIKSLSDSIR